MRIDSLAGPQLTELWSLRPDVLVEADTEPGGAVEVHTRWGSVRFERPSAALHEALKRMQLGPVSLANVLPGFPVDPPQGGPGADGADPEVRALLADLDRLRGAVVRSLAYGGTPLLSLVPLTPGARCRPAPLPPGRRVRLSRFAVLRYAAGGLQVESPIADHRVELHRPEAMRVLGLLDGAEPLPAAEEVVGLPRHLVAGAAGYLVAAGVAVVARELPGAKPEFAEDRDPRLAHWSPDELMAHSRSRAGRHDRDLGASYPHGATPVPEPVTASGAAIELHRPDLAALAENDPSFTEVLERRHSVREFAAEKLTVHQIGELLFRAARVRAAREAAAGDPPALPRTDRPYPSTGAVYALEVYLVVADGTELAPGAYHYDPFGHRLRPLAGSPKAVEELIGAAQTAVDSAARPPLLIVFTARFRRVMHAFSGIAYASLLKDVGVLLQNFYLVATAMGLGGCALAAGDSDSAARAFGLDWPVESSVGEFVVGAPARSIPLRCGIAR
ncbi:SagB family peptide dehydrogenase [Kitasatospora sp. NPDC058965]|uniref:SagB family peptide dehydrogenase n=1 Tax=Kitasatospora sp. NPDC058965 TaxID=3346682 RepID=UPI00367A75E4